MDGMLRSLHDGALIIIANAHFINEFNQKKHLNCSKVSSTFICEFKKKKYYRKDEFIGS